jgi:replication factor C subunit 3/5
VNTTDNGVQALMQLANGDMRRVLNLLQSTHMAYPQVSEETVYLTAGAAVPKIIEGLLKSLLNDTFLNCYNLIFKVSS